MDSPKQIANQQAPVSTSREKATAEGEAMLTKAAQSLDATRQLIFRSYIAELSRYEVAPPSPSDEVNLMTEVRLFRLGRLVQENKESALESATAAYTALGAAGYFVFLIVHSDGKRTELFIGTRALDGQGAAAGKLLEETFRGHFPGSELKNIPGTRREKSGWPDSIEELLSLTSKVKAEPATAVTAVTGIPALTTDEREHFTQGLERFLDAAEGRAYTALLLAEPVSTHQLQQVRLGYEFAASQIAPLAKLQMSYGSNESETVGMSLTEGISVSLGESMSLTETTSKSNSLSMTTSTNESRTTNAAAATIAGAAAVAGGAVGFALGAPGGPLAVVGSVTGAMIGSTVGGAVGSALGGAFGSKTSGSSESQGNTSSNSHSRGENRGTTKSKARNKSRSESENRTDGSSCQLTIDMPNKVIEQLLEKIDDHLERLDEARAYGGWQTAAYFISDNTETAQTLGSIYLGLMRGAESGAEDFALNTWNRQNATNRNLVLSWLSNLTHPRLRPEFADVMKISAVTPAAMLSGREMALQLGLPRRSAAAVAVLEAPAYGRRVRLLELEGTPQNSERAVLLGCIRHLWRDTTEQLHLGLDELTKHALVTGTTGTGKTTAVKSLLAQVQRQGIPFLVVEPAKGEYRNLRGLSTPEQPVHYFIAGRTGLDSLRMNPLVFPEGIQLADHVDRVCTVFNAAFPMYAAMPQVLEEAIFTAYEELGWDSVSSRCVGGRRFPTLRRIADLIPEVVKTLGYSEQLSSDYTGALSTRLRSMCRGSLGMTLLCSEEEETNAEVLFGNSCIVDLSPLGSPEKRALLMGMIVARLYEHRMAVGLPSRPDLRHLLVLEEAHTLLGRTSKEQTQDASNPRGLAVESFGNAMAEMRAYGQAFLVADQSASALDDCVLRNTNTKITFRAPFEQDRVALGGALALDEEQTRQLARLENFTAVVHQSTWLEPVLCRMTKEEIPMEFAPSSHGTGEFMQLAKSSLLLELLRARLPEELTSQDVDKLPLEEALETLPIDPDERSALRNLATRGGRVTAVEMKPIFLRLFPALSDSTFTSMALSVEAHWNRTATILQAETGLGAELLNAVTLEALTSLEDTGQMQERLEQYRTLERRGF